MKFSFAPGKYRFKCIQCGNCCYPGALSLTPIDFQEVSRNPRASRLIAEDPNPPFSHALVCKGRCPFLNDGMLCNIYENRPAVCVSFPLAFSYTPDGEMYVNFIRCPGLDAQDGELVDEVFVQNTIREVERRNPNYFRELKNQKASSHQLLLPFYSQADLTDFDSKQQFKERLAQMVVTKLLDKDNLRADYHAFLGIVKEALESSIRKIIRTSNLQKVILFKEDIVDIEAQTRKSLDAGFDRLRNEFLGLISAKEQEAVQSGVCEIFWDGEIRKVRLDEALESTEPTGVRKTVVASNFFMKRKFSSESFRIILEHLFEVMVRVDLGGFPMDAPLLVMLDTIGEYVNNLETSCYIHSQAEGEVTEEVTKKVIQDLDTFFVLGGLYSSRMGLRAPSLT